MIVELKGKQETIELMKALLAKYPNRQELSKKSGYTISYLSYLSTGKRVASREFCNWVKAEHGDLKTLCQMVQFSKVMD